MENEIDDQLFRCSVCEREFDEMPSDGMHTVHGRMPTKGGDYIDVDGECGPVYEVKDA